MTTLYDYCEVCDHQSSEASPCEGCGETFCRDHLRGGLCQDCEEAFSQETAAQRGH